jgi:hypothetical protein
MPKRFAAMVLFHDPNDVSRAVASLAAVGCEYTIDPESVDPCGPTVFGMVTGTTELDDDDLHGWLLDILCSRGGDVIEWGYERDVSCVNVQPRSA